ncbi:MAG: hypothetical protein ACRCR6_11950 [Plesiomonas sp.]
MEIRRLCKWGRDEYSEHFALLCEITRKPKFSCERCGRSARKKRYLCKPRKRDEQ